ncbi:MAG TPA: ATP-binding protein [Candidatus Dormibacteraeota bacterium]|nr:ATP-binding protein [Candidatus Dormibacteraeota bacterium]
MMQRALKFRRRLIEGLAFLLFILLVGVFAGARSAIQTRFTNQWVSHTQEVLAEAASVRLYRSRMHNYIWLYRASGRPDLLDRYEADRAILDASIARLRALTADNPNQQELVSNIGALIREQIDLLDQAVLEAQLAARNGQPQSASPILPTESKLPELLDKFERTERGLLAERTANVEKNGRWALGLLLATGILGCASLLLLGYYIQREILTHAKIEGGLIRAQELMGTQLDQQRSELGHAMDDLHTQILARNKAEDAMRRLNAELEERVARRTQELEESNRELESFNYSVSHDLRAPLRHMDGFSRILEEEFAPQLTRDACNYLHRIRMAAAHMSALVDDLLELSRLGRQEVKSQTISLGELLEEIKSAYEEEEKTRQIIWRISPLPRVEADPGLLRQVFANLISNALKFTRNKTPAVIEIGSRCEGTDVIVYVKDNGAGFDPNFADKLFGVFQRLHRQDEFEGTGIGLAIVSRIIQKHGGRVWAESAPDCGATFYFSLAVSRTRKALDAEAIGANA